MKNEHAHLKLIMIRYGVNDKNSGTYKVFEQNMLIIFATVKLIRKKQK